MRVTEEVDPDQEMAEIHLHEEQGPAILFENVKGSPSCSLQSLHSLNAFASSSVTHFKTSSRYQVKARSKSSFKAPLKYAKLLPSLMATTEKSFSKSAPVFKNKTTIDQLPATISWPDDGGRFVTLPRFTLKVSTKKVR